MQEPQNTLRIQTIEGPTDAELDAQLEELRAPAKDPQLARALISQGAQDLQEIFDSLPRSSEPVKELGELVHWQRAPSNEVREFSYTLANGETRSGELVHFDTSAEIWVARFPHEDSDKADFGIYSWFGMHDPSAYKITPGGDAIAERGGVFQTVEEEVLDLLAKCRDHQEYRAIKALITGTPTYKDADFLESLSQQIDPSASATRILRNLPEKVFEYHFSSEDEVFLLGISPANRQDLEFYDADGNLNEEAVREAVPDIIQIYEALDAAGFEPWIEAESYPGGTIPMLELYIKTETALQLVEM